MTSLPDSDAPAPLERPVVLLIEDDPMLGTIIQRILASHGFMAVLARSGPAALPLHAAHLDDLALVLCDLKLPGMDGFATLEALHRAQPDLRAVSMSGVELTAEQQARLATCGVMAHLPKPFEIDTLVAHVRQAVELRLQQPR